MVDNLLVVSMLVSVSLLCVYVSVCVCVYARVYAYVYVRLREKETVRVCWCVCVYMYVRVNGWGRGQQKKNSHGEHKGKRFLDLKTSEQYCKPPKSTQVYQPLLMLFFFGAESFLKKSAFYAPHPQQEWPVYHCAIQHSERNLL